MGKTIYNKEYRDVLLWLKQERQKRGITLRQLADRIGVHHSVIGRIEQGERRMDIVEFARLCSEIGCAPEEGLRMITRQKPITGKYPLREHSPIKKAAEPRSSYRPRS